MRSVLYNISGRKLVLLNLLAIRGNIYYERIKQMFASFIDWLKFVKFKFKWCDSEVSPTRKWRWVDLDTWDARFRGKEKTRAAQNSCNFCYLIGWRQDDQKTVLLKVFTRWIRSAQGITIMRKEWHKVFFWKKKWDKRIYVVKTLSSMVFWSSYLHPIKQSHYREVPQWGVSIGARHSWKCFLAYEKF